MSNFDDDDEMEPRGFFAANKLWMTLGTVGLLTAGGVIWQINKGSGSSAPARQEHITMLTPLPPPPPKPTPPPVQPPPDQKVVEKKAMADDTKQDVAKQEPPKAPDEPAPTMGSNIKGAGNDGFGLAGSGNGGRIGGIGGNGTGGNPFGRYAAQVKTGVADVLRRDKRTKAEAFNLKVKLWIDDSGKITRVDPCEGAAAILVGQRVAARPPVGMPMPLTATLLATRR